MSLWGSGGVDRGQVDGDRVRGFLAAILEDGEHQLLLIGATYYIVVQLAQILELDGQWNLWEEFELDEFTCLLPVPNRVSSRFTQEKTL